MNKLAILIPSLYDRKDQSVRLLQVLSKQITAFTGEPSLTQAPYTNGKHMIHVTEFGREDNLIAVMLMLDNREQTTGTKRNELVLAAKELAYEYVAFFDDDDIPGKTYIADQMAVVKSGKDCGELWGNIYFSGKRGKPFHHSIIYDKWSENKYQYNRTPNHLNCIKTEIVAAFPFPDQVFGEDGKQSEAMAAAKALKSMHPAENVIYHYFTGKRGSDMENEYIKSLIES